MSYPLRDFIDACDAFVADPAGQSARLKLASTRMKIIEAGIPADANWTPMLRAIVALATAAHNAIVRDDRRDAIAEVMRVALGNWRGDLGDSVIAPPKAPAMKPVQYKDD